jgi:PAS domain S-box-containing protein
LRIVFYDKLINSSPEGVLITDLKGRIVFASKRLIELFGYKPDYNPVGRSIFNYLTKKDKARTLSNFSKLIKGELAGSRKYHFVKRDGSVFIGEINTSWLEGEAGKRLLISYVRDVTEAVNKEDELSYYSIISGTASY